MSDHPVLARTMDDKQQTFATQNCYPNIRYLIDATINHLGQN